MSSAADVFSSFKIIKGQVMRKGKCILKLLSVVFFIFFFKFRENQTGSFKGTAV